MLTLEQLQSLKRKVITNQVKTLREYELKAINNQPYDTLMKKSTFYLLQEGILTWPLTTKEQELVDSISDLRKIPRYIKLLIEKHSPFTNCSPHQQLWLYKNNYTTIPKCNTCGKETKWSVKCKRFKIHCSNKCRAVDPKVEEKRKQTCIKRYGHDCSLSEKKHIEKTRITCMENNGVLFPLQKQEIFDATEKTKKKKYGPQYKNIIVEKVLNTLQQNYNTQGNFGEIMSTPKFLDKRVLTSKSNWFENRMKVIASHTAKPLFNITAFGDRFDKLPYECVKCETVFEDSIQDGTLPRCPTCYPLRRTNWKEAQVTELLKKHYKGEILTNRRDIIPPFEIDIFIPDKNLAIEYNGLYWHSDIGSRGKVDKNYHKNKTKLCTKKGIDLIHIFEDDWIEKQPLIISIIKQRLGIFDRKIPARKCNIQIVNNKEKGIFLDQNHIQGAVGSKINLGLYFEDELVQLMTFGVPRFNKSCEWELIRLCSKHGVSVIGGVAKLFAYFIKNYSPKNVISYCDISLFSGNVYEKLGFEYKLTSAPTCSYVNISKGCPKRINRISLQKHKLKNILENFDETKSANENLLNNNYGRIYNCGQKVFIWERDS